MPNAPINVTCLSREELEDTVILQSRQLRTLETQIIALRKSVKDLEGFNEELSDKLLAVRGLLIQLQKEAS